MPQLSDGFGEAQVWRTLPNGVVITRAVFWGGNTDYEATRGDDEVGHYHVERYHPVDGNNCTVMGVKLSRTYQMGNDIINDWKCVTFQNWLNAVKAL